MKVWLAKVCGAIRDHFIKIFAAVGATLLSLDLADYASGVSAAAAQYLGDKPAHKIGIALFVLLFLRATYFTWSQRAK